MKPITTRALIVEDNPSWQAILSEILMDHGLQVEVVDNLEQAISRLSATPFRLAIIDLSLEGQNHHNQDGLEVLKAVKQLNPGCVSILLTGYASVELAVAVIQEYGAFTCLRKDNFRRAEFRTIVHQALAASLPVKAISESSDEIGAKQSGTAHKVSDVRPAGLALVVEDDAGWRGLLDELLQDSGYQVHVCSSYGEAQGLLKREHYQLVVVDISLASSVEPSHNQDGYRLLKTIQQAKIPTVIVSGYADPDLIDRAYDEHRIFACFEKQSFVRSAFVQTVQQVSEQSLLSYHLTERELDVLALLAQGLSNKEIAAKLFITTNTVKRHLKSIYSRLNVNTRAAASAYAIRFGLATRMGKDI